LKSYIATIFLFERLGSYAVKNSLDSLKRLPHSEPHQPKKTSRTLDPKAVLSSIGEVVYDWNIENDSMMWGANAAKVFGVSNTRKIAKGHDFESLIAKEQAMARMEAISSSEQRDFGAGIPYRVEYALQPDGQESETILWVEENGRWFANAHGHPIRAHGVMRIVNDRHEAEERLLQISRFDQLTGQYNRTKLSEFLNDTMDRAQKAGEQFAFMIAAIENLNVINTSYGFDIADEVIVGVAHRIKARMRGADILARYSGNKFGIILSRCSASDIPVAADRIIRGVQDEVLKTSAGPVNVTLTVGGVLAPRFARTVTDVMQKAHETLDMARTRRRQGGFAIYSPSREREQSRKNMMTMTDEVISALNEKRVQLAFQPLAETRTGRIASYECLARIVRPTGEVVSAGQVIPYLEKLGIVRLMDQRVLQLAIEQLVAYPKIRLAVNVSPDTAADPDWRAMLMAYGHQYPTIGKRLTLEITETALISNIEEAKDFISCVRGIGCRVAIDDFGSGHTSFQHLRNLGVDCVKIDGAFVQNIASSADDRFFVRTLVELAKHLKTATVAEWVQDEASAKILTDLGVDYLQGSYIGMGTLTPAFAKEKRLRLAGI
jgi:diguanylate cyclase (GGDEF)-like protein